MALKKNSWKKAGLVLSLLLPIFLQAQPNLVLNPSFEQYTGICGSFNSKCTGSTITSWDSPTSGSPDFFDTCGNKFSNGMPSNYFGYQYPRTGNAYAGFTFGRDGGCLLCDGYEYIEGELTNTLIANKKYCVSYYVSLGDSLWYASSSLGAYLSVSAPCMAGFDTLPYVPQIKNISSNIITDKVDWVPISGEFTSLGGEQYITVGSFDSLTPLFYVGGGANSLNGNYTYYYIDDVSVRELVIARAGQDTSICNGQPALIGEDSAVPGVSYYWQPATGLANPYSAQTLATPTITTTYTLTVVNDSARGCNCPDSISRSMVTVNVCRAPLFVPTAFSPNGDGQNDILLVKGNDIQSFYLAIYDRWGNKVFESNDINDGWDGTYKGKNENAGTYVYYLKGTYTDGNNFEKKGSVALVR